MNLNYTKIKAAIEATPNSRIFLEVPPLQLNNILIDLFTINIKFGWASVGVEDLRNIVNILNGKNYILLHENEPGSIAIFTDDYREGKPTITIAQLLNKTVTKRRIRV